MRAPLLAILIVAVGAFAYPLSQRSGSESAAAEEAVSVRVTDGAALAIFDEVCIEGRESFAQTESRALASGWTQVPDDVHPNVARIMAISRGAEVLGASNILMHAYAHSSRSQYMVLTSLTVSGVPVNGCYIYDFGVSGLPEPSDLEASLGEPSERTSQPGVVDAKKWVRPSPFPTVATLRMGYFPAGSPAVEQVGF